MLADCISNAIEEVKTKMKNGYCPCFLLFLMLCLTIAEADVFHLKGGGLVEGEIVEKSE